MHEPNLLLMGAVDKIRKKHLGYRRGAYVFVYESIDYTVKMTGKERGVHVSAKELLSGIRKMAVEYYGPFAKEVLLHWRVFSCEDFATIIDHLAEFEVLSKQASDRCEDFVNDGFDFDKAFA
jgi:uncharacterized repeat protein (TIGR04138 family)